MRHAKPDFTWEKSYDSAAFDAACAAYDEAGADAFSPDVFDARDKTIYVSDCRRALETAKAMFPDAEIVTTDLLREVPLRSFRDTTKSLPLWYWNLRGRLQWMRGSARQPETRQETTRRAEAFVDLLEKEDRDAVLITHGFYLTTLLKALRIRGFVLTRSGMGKVDYLERVRATKRADHCGACVHNCTLKNPGCGVGVDKARREGYT